MANRSLSFDELIALIDRCSSSKNRVDRSESNVFHRFPNLVNRSLSIDGRIASIDRCSSKSRSISIEANQTYSIDSQISSIDRCQSTDESHRSIAVHRSPDRYRIDRCQSSPKSCRIDRCQPTDKVQIEANQSKSIQSQIAYIDRCSSKFTSNRIDRRQSKFKSCRSIAGNRNRNSVDWS